MIPFEKYLFGVLAVFVCISLKEIFYSGSLHDSKLDSNIINFKKHIPETHFSNVMTGPTLRISYCHSCGYRRIFEDYSRIVLENFPHISVIGDHHSPEPKKVALARFISAIKFILIGLIISNINPFAYLGLVSPSIWNILSQHRLYSVLVLFFLCNAAEDRLLRTGAFEITYNGVLVWSKLKNGRLLLPSELFQLINNQDMRRGERIFADLP